MNSGNQQAFDSSGGREKRMLTPTNSSCSRVIVLGLLGVGLLALGTTIINTNERAGILTAGLGLLVLIVACMQGTKYIQERHGRFKGRLLFFVGLLAGVFLIAALWGVAAGLFAFCRSVYLFEKGISDRALRLCTFAGLELILGVGSGLLAMTLLRSFKGSSKPEHYR